MEKEVRNDLAQAMLDCLVTCIIEERGLRAPVDYLLGCGFTRAELESQGFTFFEEEWQDLMKEARNEGY